MTTRGPCFSGSVVTKGGYRPCIYCGAVIAVSVAVGDLSPGSPTAETMASNTIQCGFESHPGHHPDANSNKAHCRRVPADWGHHVRPSHSHLRARISCPRIKSQFIEQAAWYPV